MKRLALVLAFLLAGCTEQQRARTLGGNVDMDVAPCRKVMNVTWKPEGSLWILTRPMRLDETPERLTFNEKSNFGMVEGSVTLIEHACVGRALQ